MNSVYEQCPNSNLNSDLNSAQNSALHQAACPMSRPHFDVATSRQPESSRDTNPLRRPQVATLCRDINFMSRPHWRQTYVATSTSCRDLLHCRPCRDIPTLLPMSRPQNDVATSNQLNPISATSRRHFSMSRPPLQPPMSRPQAQLATSCCNSARSRRPFPGRDLTSHHTRSRPQIHVATSTGPNLQPFFFFFFYATP